ncbi:Laccase-6 [Frankliniella fusca]|uniref:Laccase-6 n=1 Tax=Frankliniella fusca TaxID=407009 RepID=A0AAE1LJE2_9NEOP|nr:Laccase-6 [Frankliniella fusca]
MQPVCMSDASYKVKVWFEVQTPRGGSHSLDVCKSIRITLLPTAASARSRGLQKLDKPQCLNKFLKFCTEALDIPELNSESSPAISMFGAVQIYEQSEEKIVEDFPSISHPFYEIARGTPQDLNSQLQ